MNVKDGYERTSLHLAIKYRNIHIVNALIAKGADVNAKDDYGKTLLHLASRYNNLEAVSTLIENGADVNEKDIDGNTPLHLSKNEDIVNALIEKESFFNNLKNKCRNIFKKI
ncbi:MAG: ankyrin repeat domain-containing protein [Bdellovibrionales bacterium]|nr:ankyrin repeat domain-containing protein [Bdellovibrionales bacterium]